MSIVASVSDELKFHVWPEGTLYRSYNPIEKNDNGHVQSISWSKDGAWVVLVPNSGAAEIVSIKEDAKLLQTIKGIYYPQCAAFQNNTKRNISVGTLSGQILTYDIKSRRIRKRFPRSSSSITTLEYNAKDSHIAAGCSNGDVLLFNNTSANLSSSYKIPRSDSVSAINFHRTKRNVLSAGSEEGIVAVWDINTNALQFSMMAHQAPITDLKLSPIRSDLLVTSGSDRRFTFFDLVTKKRILEVDVSSSITSLDFSNCGMYLGLGGQNGNIVMYDTRNLTKPVSAFEAHSRKRIYHLLFQKVLLPCDQATNSFYDITMAEPVEESPLCVKPEENVAKSSADSDSISILTYDVSNTQVNTKEEMSRKKFTNEAPDSFLDAVGIDSSVHSDTSAKRDSGSGLGITEEVKKWMDASKRTVLAHSSSQKSILIQTPAISLKQVSSTPKYTHLLQETLPSNVISPIISSSQTIPTEMQAGTAASQQFPISKDELKEMIREVFRAEMKNQIETYKNEMKAEFTDTLFHIRSYFLNLHMLLVKEFVKIEDVLLKMNASRITECTGDAYLISQNHKLIKEIQVLKEQLFEKDQTKY